MSAKHKRLLAVSAIALVSFGLLGARWANVEIHRDAWRYAKSFATGSELVSPDQYEKWDERPEIKDFKDLESIFGWPQAYPKADVDFSRYKQYPAHNYHGAGGNAFATLLCTENSTLRDPYFSNTQSLVW